MAKRRDILRTGLWGGASLPAWAADDPTHVDLTSLNAEDLASLGTPIATVKDAIESGYLAPVKIFSDLIQVM